MVYVIVISVFIVGKRGKTRLINPFQANVPFLYPLKPQGDVFRGYRKGTLAWNELILWTICFEQCSRGFLKEVTWTKIAAKTLGHSFSDIDGKCTWSCVFYWAELLILWASSFALALL